MADLSAPVNFKTQPPLASKGSAGQAPMLRVDSVLQPGPDNEAVDPAMGPQVEAAVLEQYDREHIALRRYLLFIGVADASAQDIVQETFLRLHRHLSQRGDQSNLRAWIYRVAHNLARNEQTSARNTGAAPLTEEVCTQIEAGECASPESQLLLRERDERLREAIQMLSPVQRESIVLRAQGMKYREIAAIQRISTASVGENIQRALERLKDLL